MAEASSVIASDSMPEAPEPQPVTPQSAEPLTSKCIAYRSSEELVAKAIAPVKREFICPPPNRPNSSAAVKKDDVTPHESKSDSTKVVKEKKSKRQLKRERREERNSALHLCPEIAKTGDVSSCRYGDGCRFSHDWETYKAQKPDDLEGQCPFTCAEKRCPYGVTCRFAATHKDIILMENSVDKKNSEVNILSKDVQKLLWKNKMKFTKADYSLKNLGLSVKGKSKQNNKEDIDESDLSLSNGTNVAQGNGKKKDDESFSKVESCQDTPYEESVDHAPIVDESRPVKRAKSRNDDAEAPSGGTNGSGVSDNFLDKSPLVKETCLDDGILPETDASLRLHRHEKKLIDFSRKLYLAPLTTVGNLPFRRVCKVLGADVTCGEMAMCTNLLQGQASEWALLRRHSSEDFFGVQICGAYPDTVARTVELIDQECSIDFIDINMGCPIDIVVNKGAGSALLTKPLRLQNVIRAASNTVNTPITVKVRTGYFEGRSRVDSLIADIGDWGATAVTVHGRSRQQRYSKLADWNFIDQCAKKAPDTLQVLGNGDIFSYLDWNKHISDSPELSSCMIARGALLKPWLFTEIKEQRHWDISSGERLDILKDYVRFGLEHWGSDSKGVETTRHFLLEWLSYTCRYIPVGLLDVVPQKLNWRPPSYFGRNDLETLMASDSAADWIRISEILLGKVPTGFTFAPKHKSNAYDSAENG